MHAFDVLGDPVRRRILEILADKGILSSGEIVEIISAEFGISQSAVSQHLKVLRDAGLVTVRAEGTRNLYAVDLDGLGSVRAWVDSFWNDVLAAFTEYAESEES